METYFGLVSQELITKLKQIKVYIKKHNSTIGILTEEILREFLRVHLPKVVSVEQGFILNSSGELSRQCDIIIYDSQWYSPFYRINDIIVVPEESVLAVIEVKTTINKSIFHDTIKYFSALSKITNARKHLFIFNARPISRLGSYFETFKHEGTYQHFDHDTFEYLPDQITGINPSYHLCKDYVITDSDSMGYISRFYKDLEGTEVSALQLFFISIYEMVEAHIEKGASRGSIIRKKRSCYHPQEVTTMQGIELFLM